MNLIYLSFSSVILEAQMIINSCDIFQRLDEEMTQRALEVTFRFQRVEKKGLLKRRR